MALFLNLPVYKTVYDLTLAFSKARATMPRDARYTVGQDVTRTLIEILTLVYRANATRDKAPLIANARRLAVQVQIYFRLMSDLHYINLKQTAQFAEMTDAASKQFAAWHKAAQRVYNDTKNPSATDGRPECAGSRSDAARQQVKSIMDGAVRNPEETR